MVDENRIKEKIREIHSGDDRQLEVIFSDKERIIVEAPAGYGKTTTMVSRLAYLYSIQAISNPKKILGLTFSVNAALKIKRDIASKLPRLINQNNDPTIISNTVTVTNYHGFCKSVLKKYGRLVNALLIKDLNLFRAVGEDDIKKFSELNSLITSEEAEILFGVDDSIKSGLLPSNDKIEKYIEIISEKFLPKDIVTHTAILLMALKLFEKKEIAHFYQNYYSIIVVDEFQDTKAVLLGLKTLFDLLVRDPLLLKLFLKPNIIPVVIGKLTREIARDVIIFSILDSIGRILFPYVPFLVKNLINSYVTAIVGLVVSDIIRAYLGLPLEFFSLVDIVDQTAFGFFRTEFDKAVFGYAFAAVNLGIQLATFLLPSDLFTSAILNGLFLISLT